MLTAITIILLILLLIIGIKLPHRNEDGKLELHKDSMSLEVTKSLRGFAAIGVLLHHISQENAFQQANGWGVPGELPMFVNAGFYFVAIFFFCSGYGLIKSLNSKPDYLNGFIKKRVVKTLVIPFYVNVILYALYFLVTKTQLPLGRWICNFLGLSLMNEYAWFPIVLALLYVAFYFIFKNVKNQKIAYLLMFLVIFLQGVFFCFNGHFAWWAGPKNWWLSEAAQNAPWWADQYVIWFFGEWWVNSSIALLVGMIFASKDEQIRKWFTKLYPLKLILTIVLWFAFSLLSGFCQAKFGYWSEWSGLGPGILNKFICYCSQLPQVISFVIFIYALLLFIHSENPVTKFFGNISFETYMMNLIPIQVFRFLLYSSNQNQGASVIRKPYHYNLAIYAVAVIAASVILGLLYKWINNTICKKIK